MALNTPDPFALFMRWFEAEKLEVVFVSAGDDQAAAFYERLGFERTRGAWLYRVPGCRG